jgi:hypothetical protein
MRRYGLDNIKKKKFRKLLRDRAIQFRTFLLSELNLLETAFGFGLAQTMRKM